MVDFFKTRAVGDRKVEATSHRVGILAHASGLTGTAPNPVAFSLGYNANDIASVDAETEKVRPAGARIVKEPHRTHWDGSMPYFRDPDGHLWEIVHVPSIVVDDEPADS